MLTRYPPIFEASFDVRENERIQRRLLLPADTDVLIVTSEHGRDVRLEVKRDDELIARADSPLSRIGTQRIWFRTLVGEYSMEIIAREGGAAPAQVEIRALAFRDSQSDHCIGLNRRLAAADAQFAAGQMVTLGLALSSTTDAAQAYADSASGYAAAAAELTASGTSMLLAETQHAEAAALYWGVQNWEGACMAADRSMHSYDDIGSPYGAAKAGALLAAALMEMDPSVNAACGTSPGFESESRSDRIRRLLVAAAAFHERRGESYDQAVALNDLGLSLSMHDDYEHAIATFEEALPLYERAGETLRQAQTLQNIALADFELGRLSKALPRYALALDLIQPERDPTLYAAILNNSALASTYAGDHDTALRQLSQALALSRTAQDKWWQANILDNIGQVYHLLGDEDLALEFYGQSLSLADAELNSSGRYSTLLKMATIERERGEVVSAVAHGKEALSLAVSPFGKASASIGLAAGYRASGQLTEAARLLATVLQENKVATADFNHGKALLERGQLSLATNDAQRAAADFRTALQIFQTLEVPEHELSASLGLARSLQRRGQLDDALKELRHTLQLAEELRVRSANPELRAQLLKTSRPAFDLKIEMLANLYATAADPARRRGLAMEALETAEQARARALADFVRLDLTAPGVSSPLMQQRQSAYTELAARRQRLETLLETSRPDDARLGLIRADIATLRQQLNDIDARLAATSIRPATAEVQLTPLRLAIDLQAIPPDAAIVEYWLGRERAFAWTITHEGIALVDLGTTAAITHAAMALHSSLQSIGSVPVAERLRRATNLYQLIVQPLHLEGKPDLMVAADGALHYVPFAVLRSSADMTDRFLVENHDVTVVPSVRMLFDTKSLQPRQATRRMLLVADPAYGSNKVVTQGVEQKVAYAIPDLRGPENLRRLPGTAMEAAAVSGLFQKDQLDTLQGTAATRERFLATDFGRYRFIHIASHAVADAEIPQLSALILSTVDQKGHPTNGRVLAADLLGIRLNAELVVLSGCETALGKRVDGEGLIGLQYIMVARGAHSVMSSLWNVPDIRTAELMSRFYTAVLRNGSIPRTALSSAMRSMISEGADPGIWSAFSLTTRSLPDAQRSARVARR